MRAPMLKTYLDLLKREEGRQTKRKIHHGCGSSNAESAPMASPVTEGSPEPGSAEPALTGSPITEGYSRAEPAPMGSPNTEEIPRAGICRLR